MFYRVPSFLSKKISLRGAGAVLVRVRVRFAGAGAGAVMVRVEFFAHFGVWKKHVFEAF